MKKCNWEKIENFRSLNEFKLFEEWMKDQVRVGNAKQISVESPYIGATSFDEKWFICFDSGLRWRLVAPDPPFEGLFEPID